VATLTLKTIILGGVDVTTFESAAAGGDEFVNDGSTFLAVNNASGGSINVTINSQVNCDQGFDHNQVVAVAAGKLILMGPYPMERWNDPDDKVQVSYSAVTSLTVIAAKL